MFRGCIAHISITILKTVTTLSEKVFKGCISLKFVTMPMTMTSLGNNVVHSCTALESITIPDTVTAIHSDVISGCTALAFSTMKTVEQLSCISSELGHNFGEEILFIYQKIEALALECFER